MKKPTLYLLPNLLDEELSHADFMPKSIETIVASLDGLIAESERGARRFLRRFSKTIPIKLLNEHTKDIKDLLSPISKGEHWGLISDCGLPCLADPGADLVLAARNKGIHIETVTGPSSLIFALLLSGLPAQAFAFHGYLPREQPALIKQIKLLEERSKKEKATQAFIEAPYRSQRMLETLIENLSNSTLLCAAWDLTLPTQGVITQPISAWRKTALPDLKNKPTVFLI